MSDEIKFWKKQYFTEQIMNWAFGHLRSFPWRKNRSFYYVLISELFLQRTKVAQVLPVYLDFIREYPTLQDLYSANSVDSEYIKTYFKKLGLLKRFKYLQQILSQLKNTTKSFQDFSEKDLKKLPGIGKYTARAILCFGFHQKKAIVDSNIIRIFQRFFAYSPKRKPARYDTRLWEFAEELLPDKKFDIYQYALIDFGSLVCTPKNPNCSSCLLEEKCSTSRC